MSEVPLFQNLTSAPDRANGEADEATRGGNWGLRAARRQEEIDAGNDIVNNKLSALSNSNHLKDTDTTGKPLNPNTFPVRKLLFAVTGRPEIV